MRISDWSSDVCSSDLPRLSHPEFRVIARGNGLPIDRVLLEVRIGVDALFLDEPTTNIPALIGVGTVVRDRNAKLMYGDACRLAKHAEIATVGLRPIIAGAVIVGARDVIALSRERRGRPRSEEHTSELQSLMRQSYAVSCLEKKT